MGPEKMMVEPARIPFRVTAVFEKLDVFIPKSRPFLSQQFARARKETLSTEPTVEAMVASAEDTLLAKLEWFRMGGEVSERQWRDVLGILEVQAGSLDLEYLQRWAQELKVSDLLARAFEEGNLNRSATVGKD